MKDLIALVADKKMEAGVTALVRREANFQIRPITADVYRHPHHDAGVLLEATDFLQVFRNSHQHAIVLFDREGCGRDALDPAELQRLVQEKLDAGGWQGVRRDKLMRDQSVKVRPEKRRSCHLRTELCTWWSNPPS
ncbi:MAG: hypothetical protein NTX53_05535 [candidate division WOR-3 bacterium]|nr:hypothetical protein [candidate division WOR-3 bacterium]